MSKKDYKKFSSDELIREIDTLQEQLVEVDKIHRQFADNVSDVIWIYDYEEEKFTYISPSIQNLLGYTSQAALEMNLTEFILPEAITTANK